MTANELACEIRAACGLWKNHTKILLTSTRRLDRKSLAIFLLDLYIKYAHQHQIVKELYVSPVQKAKETL